MPVLTLKKTGIVIPNHKRMTIKLVIFDFDGTIAQTQDAIIGIINQLAPEFGYAPLSEAKIEHFRHLTAKEIIKQSDVPLWQVPFLVRRIRQELKQQITLIQATLGIEQALEQLKQQQYYLGILTSNSEENACQFLRHHGLLHYFNFVESSSYLWGKDKVIKRLINERNLSPEAVMYVGDEIRDITAAHQSGVKVTAVSWGFNSVMALAKYQPYALISHPSQLPLVMKQESALIPFN